MPKVVIVGGGVGGLSAAHELSERGLTVEVYEKRDILGGKARSVGVPNFPPTGARKPLPGEDGFRFFPGFYKHVPDTMRRIPRPGGGTVLDNLVNAKQIGVLQEGKAPYVFPSDTPVTVEDWRRAIEFLFTRPELGLPRDEALFFAGRLLCILSSCEKRRLEQYEGLSWWDFIGAATRSQEYNKFCAKGLTRSLVAMRSEEGSTRTVGVLLIQIILDIILTSRGPSDRVLNGPTNEVWIDPWRDYLVNTHGVAINTQHEALAVNYDPATNRIASVTIKNLVNNAVRNVQGDYYILAVPVDVMNGRTWSSPLITHAIRQAAPSLANLDQVPTSWMVGAQFYLNRRLATQPVGHSIYTDSMWAVTSIAQAQFWPGRNIPALYGDGSVQDILSCDISEWKELGDKVFHGPAEEAGNEDDIKREVWAHLKAHWATSAGGQLNDGDVQHFFLSPQIEWRPFNSGVRPFNTEPLLINRVNTLRFRPEAGTEIPNLFLASDYVRTHTDLASMEAADEAGRRAANRILNAEGYGGSRAGVWPLQEPAAFDVLKQADEQLYALGLPSPLCALPVPSAMATTSAPSLTPFDWVMLGLLSLVVILLIVVLVILLL